MISSDNRRIIKIYKKAQLWLGFFVLIISLISCKKQNQVYTITGNTMGTTYSIKIVDNLSQDIDLNIIKANIDSVLQEVNQQMSTYIMDSEISRFNRFVSNDWFSVSNNFYDVIVAA